MAKRRAPETRSEFEQKFVDDARIGNYILTNVGRIQSESALKAALTSEHLDETTRKSIETRLEVVRRLSSNQ